MADDGTYITVAEVRRTVGITSTSTISDADVGGFITAAEAHAPDFFNTVFTPKTKIEVRNGNGTNRMILRKNPVLADRDLYINGTQEETGNLHVKKGSGRIELSSSATASTFINKANAVTVKYIYGWMEESSTSDTSTAATTAGTNVDISISGDSDDFENGWIEIYGMDGYREVAQVTAVSTNQITVDQLVYSHESGSTIVLLQVNENFKQFMRIVASLSIVARIVGQSSTDITGYTLTEFQVQKGEPYTQWRETAVQLIKERDRLLEFIKPRPCIM